MNIKNRSLPLLLILPLLFFSIVFSVKAQGGPPSFTPSGLIEAPPCRLDPPDHFPSQAKVPCNGIVIFPEGTSQEARAALVQEVGGIVQKNYQNVAGTAVHLPHLGALEGVLSHPELELIPDRPVEAYGKPGSGGGITAQVIPAGVNRIGAPKVWATAKVPNTQIPITGAGVGVAIVDTGLDFFHSDLHVSSTCHDSFGGNCQDQAGHGTHVGGIVAALNNNQDVVGVAPGATLYAVRVLNANGSGTDSTVMDGLDWVLSHANSVSPPIRVLNMSLGREGTLNDNPAYHLLVQHLSQAGITVVVAAGNDQSLEVAQNIPATYPEVLAVASSTAVSGSNQCRWVSSPIKADTASYFTTDGAFDEGTGIGVTISAPGGESESISKSCLISGLGILSTRLGGGTTRMSGTSMASPHTTGVVALLVQASGGNLDPEAARDLIRSSASLSGTVPYDSPTNSYSYDGEREGILSACGALGIPCL